MSQGNGKNGTNGAKIGVYVCHCGVNIASTVDVCKVRDALAERCAEHF